MGNKNNTYNQGAWNMGCGCDNGCAEPINTCGCEQTTCPANRCGCAETACGCDQTACSATRCSYETAAANHRCGCAHECANETHIIYEACDGYKEVTVTNACQESVSPGRVLDVTATLTNVCPGRCSAVGLTLTELDANGAEHARGFRAISVPAHNGRCNRDITLDAVRFVLPEENGCQQQRRHFIVRTQHHYLDAGAVWNTGWGQ